MKQPLVSIILPVYNAQSHLARCLSSICAQTYQNLEIIVLNDGSKDQSLPVCEEFRKKDSRIILVDKANSGVSDTRNLGLNWPPANTSSLWTVTTTLTRITPGIWWPLPRSTTLTWSSRPTKWSSRQVLPNPNRYWKSWRTSWA